MTKMLTRKSMRQWAIFILIGILAACLFPFNFFPKNRIAWESSAGGLELGDQAEMIGSIPSPIGAGESIADGGVTIAFLLQSSKTISNTLSYIFTIIDTARNEFMVGQWRNHLVVRSRFLENDQHFSEEIGINNLWQAGQMRFIALSFSSKATLCYVDTQAVVRDHALKIPDSYMDNPLQIVVGTDPKGHKNWSGIIRAIAIVGNELSHPEILEMRDCWLGQRSWIPPRKQRVPTIEFRFSEGAGDSTVSTDGASVLRFPALFRRLEPQVLVQPDLNEKIDFTEISDWVLNFLGFMPLGFLLMGGWGGRGKGKALRSILGITFIGCALSLMVELLQVNLPGRFSQLSDLVLNTLGALAGALSWFWVSPKSEL